MIMLICALDLAHGQEEDSHLGSTKKVIQTSQRCRTGQQPPVQVSKPLAEQQVVFEMISAR